MSSPAIRFAGFTEDWEEREFENLVSRVPSMAEGEPGLPSVEYEDIVSGQGQLNKNIYEKQNNKRGIYFRPGDILFGKLRPYLQNWLAPNFTGIAVGDWWVLRPNDANSEFIYALIQSLKYQEVSNLTTGTKMPRSDWNIVSKTPFILPSEMAEQAKIGATFCDLDRLITLHQREHDKTVNIKKALLEKMLPKDGEDKPEIRFAGFTDAWEQRKLGDIASFSKGQGYSKGDLQEEGTPIILYGRLYTKYETVISSVDTFVHAKENSVYSRGNEVIVPASGETAEDIARAAVVEDAGILLGGDLNILHPHPIINPVFLALTISNGERQKDLSKRAQGKSVVHIHNSDLQEVILAYPSLDEQNKIGPLFRNFDRLLALHKRELTKLQNIKKALLEKMFV